ncbi:MAG: S8 family peptidase [Acidimicrobiales bacterium]
MHSRRLTRFLSLALIGGLVPLAAPSPVAAESVPTAPLVVRFESGTSPEERAADLAARGLTVLDETPGSDHVLVQADGAFAAASVVDDAVVEVAPLVTYRASGVPNDPAYRAQWHLPAIDTVSAWDVTTGTGTIVAVIDTGVAAETRGTYVQAPDLAGTRFAKGWDFVSGDAHPDDENGHGTHVAGTIAQTTNNGYGVAGVAPGTAIMPLRVLDKDGAGSDWNVAQALRFAADKGADVANLSLGSTTSSSVMADAVAYARSKGVTIVAASGNEGVGTVSYPAALDGVIAVGAVRFDLTRPAYSNYGRALDLVAPGGDMSVDQNGDGYGDGILQQTLDGTTATFCLCFMEGTSMATPQVSAVAALLAARGATDPDVIESVLVASAKDLGVSGRDDHYGNGLVQAGAAVRTPLPGPAPVDGAETEPEPAPEPAGPAAIRGIEHACPSETTPDASFSDIAGSVHAAPVSCVAWWEVANGVTAERFAPERSVTRGQMASFVARTLDASGIVLPLEPPDAFTDDDTSIHETRINQLAAIGVVGGRGTGTYAPDAVVSRAEMATFLVRAHDVVSSTPLRAGPDRFQDDETSVHEANIDKIAAAGLAGGTSATTYAPTAPVRRGQMATFLARTLDLFVATGAVPAR